MKSNLKNLIIKNKIFIFLFVLLLFILLLLYQYLNNFKYKEGLEDNISFDEGGCPTSYGLMSCPKSKPYINDPITTLPYMYAECTNDINKCSAIKIEDPSWSFNYPNNKDWFEQSGGMGLCNKFQENTGNCNIYPEDKHYKIDEHGCNITQGYEYCGEDFYPKCQRTSSMYPCKKGRESYFDKMSDFIKNKKKTYTADCPHDVSYSCPEKPGTFKCTVSEEECEKYSIT